MNPYNDLGDKPSDNMCYRLDKIRQVHSARYYLTCKSVLYRSLAHSLQADANPIQRKFRGVITNYLRCTQQANATITQMRKKAGGQNAQIGGQNAHNNRMRG